MRSKRIYWVEVPNIIRVGLENDGKLQTNLEDGEEVPARPPAPPPARI